MQFTKQQFRALVAFASDDKYRNPLSSVWLDGRRAYATDGHTLVVYEYAPMGERREPWAVRRDQALEAIKMCPKDGEITVSPPLGSGVLGTMSSGAGSWVLEPVEGVPPIDPVLSSVRSEPARKVGINPDYIARLSAVQQAAGKVGVELEVGGELEPVRATVGNWIALIMPTRL